MATSSFDQALVLGLYTESPLHCGAESGLGYVDLPVQRERHTQYPVIPGSTLKGRLKDETEAALGEHHAGIFGTYNETADPPSTTPGSVSFGDGVLVAFPVRSMDKPFRWVTCPFALERVLRLLGAGVESLDAVPRGHAWVREVEDGSSDLLLEELVLEAKARPDLLGDSGPLARLLDLLPAGEAGYDYTRERFLERLTVVSDEDFGDLVTSATDVVTRIKLNFLGTTQTIPASDPEHGKRSKEDREGNLFVEEVVPAETLFAASFRMGARDDLERLSGSLPPVVQLGGGETIGRGVTRLTAVSSGTEG